MNCYDSTKEFELPIPSRARSDWCIEAEARTLLLKDLHQPAAFTNKNRRHKCRLFSEILDY